MDIFTDFDSSFGSDFYSGIPVGDGTVDIFNGATVVDKINPTENGFSNGNMIFHSANVQGGVDTFLNGALQTHTQQNIFGGEDVYNETFVTHTEIPNEYGGVDIYGENFQHEGTTFANVYGGEDYLSAQGNVSEILSYDDPLKYVQNLRFDAFNIQ